MGLPRDTAGRGCTPGARTTGRAPFGPPEEPEDGQRHCQQASENAVGRAMDDEGEDENRGEHGCGEERQARGDRGRNENQHAPQHLDHAGKHAEPLPETDLPKQAHPLRFGIRRKLLGAEDEEQNGDASPEDPVSQAIGRFWEVRLFEHGAIRRRERRRGSKRAYRRAHRSAAPGHDEGDVVLLFAGTEAAHLVHHGGDEALRRETASRPQHFHEPLFAELLVAGVEGLDDAVGVNRERVAGEEFALFDAAIPIAEEPEDGAGSAQPFERAAGTQEKRRQMAAVGVAQAAAAVLVLGEEQGSVGALGAVSVKDLVDRPQQGARPVGDDAALNAQVRLQIGHQERGGDAFAGDVADHEPEVRAAEFQKVEVISPDLAGLDASAGIVERGGFGQRLREETGLHLPCDLEFVRGTPVGKFPFGRGVPLRFDLPGDLVEAHERERIPVGVPKMGKDASPGGVLFFGGERGTGPALALVADAPETRRIEEVDPAPAPLGVLGERVLGNEGDAGRAADEAVLGRVGPGRAQGENGFAVGRRHTQPAFAGLHAGIESDIEAEHVHVESQARLLVANIDVHGLNGEIRSSTGLRLGGTHSSDYRGHEALPAHPPARQEPRRPRRRWYHLTWFMISLTGVSKHFNGKRKVVALDSVDLAIGRGELVSIVGPSGSGKSTLLNLIGGLDRPTAGEIRIDGQAIASLSDDDLTRLRRDKIGFVFQFFNLLPSLTCLENVALPLHLKGLPGKEIDKRARELLDLVQLGPRIEHLPDELSGGERQRVAIARALVFYPPVVLADEPTGNLDSRTGREILNLVHDLHQRLNATIVIVTHDMTVAESCPRTVTLRDARVAGDVRR